MGQVQHFTTLLPYAKPVLAPPVITFTELPEDELWERGFFNALHLVMSIVQFGFLMCGPPCALFIYLSCSVHKRSKSQPWGNHEKDSVRRANVIMINLAIILTIAHERFVFIGMLSLELGIVWVDTFLGTLLGSFLPSLTLHGPSWPLMDPPRPPLPHGPFHGMTPWPL